jgi:hypothetical protein
MSIAEAQREVRTIFLNGSVGQAVSGTIWLASAATATFGTKRAAILLLVVGGMFICPLTQTVGFRARDSFAIGAWTTAAILLAFAAWAAFAYGREHAKGG